MARKRYKPEEIVGLLRQPEVLHGQGGAGACLGLRRGVIRTEGIRNGRYRDDGRKLRWR